jgi:rubredoxin
MAALASVMSPAAAASRGSAFTGARLSKRAVPMTASRARVSTVTRAGAGETLISVEKPLGVTLKASNKGVSGGVEVASAKGNAAKAGLKSGDYIVYCSSFFGDELWPADQLGFVRSAIQACPNQVDFIVVRDPKILATVDVKRLPKRPSPPRFGKKLSAAQKERASHICVDCGFVYTLPTAFAEQGRDYVCPQCNAPRSRFAKYDVETGTAIGGTSAPLVTTISTVVGLVGIGILLTQVL